MKILTLLSLVFLTDFGLGQTLTNSQVYNFDVGDIIQGRYHHAGNSNYTYETKTILNKTYSTNNDSIFYTIQLDYYITPLTSCTTCTPSTNSTTITQTITNLNQPATHGNTTSLCHSLIDSTYFDYCGKTVWGKYPIAGVGCGPGQDMEETYLVEGLGGPFYNYVYTYDPMSLQWLDHKLTYYSKASGTCGSIITSINEFSSSQFGLFIYPNPSCDYLSIKSHENFYFYDIMDLNGKVISAKYFLSNKIDIDFLPSGNYLINLYTTNNKTIRQKFTKE